ncbi:efflux RND transporter permease subunit [Pyrinomonas methylaliphatogenes]|uniref:Heavy metal efflux pump, cobalt-zinc-cadmium n=1 Tax=Pyrinomonas methylaliphatogenes TaxID=454194 RepID=A0A0B6WTZ2_9BACT|nr:CusA/CzcA family heavy metal efflux RND transporter [Pyrinomonas methylaliphatogenes]CDM64147.1 heavy metal efflux pump, cobalt-zinc-cadmium [Pyrinomonas methylaliphatogenes]
MIAQRIVAFALRQKFLIVALSFLIALGGALAFRALPVEAFPDVIDTQVQIITQWPGHAAEEVEKQITFPIETEVNGTPRLAVLRSISLFGLSIVTATFEDGTDDYFARAQIVERLQNVTLPEGVQAQLGPLASATGEIYRYTIQAPPDMPLIEVKALQDWTLERAYRSVPGVADVVSFGGGTKQFQVLVDPAKLRRFGLTLGQVFAAVKNGNGNAGGNFIQHGAEEYVVRGIGLIRDEDDIRNIVITARDGTPIRVGQIAEVRVDAGVRRGIVGRDDKPDVVEGIVLLRRGENALETLKRVEAKTEELNASLPAGVRIVPHYDRTELINRTVHTVERNLIEGALLVVLVLFIFLFDVRAALVVAVVIPFALLVAFGLCYLFGIPANLISLGAIDFGIIVDGAVVMVEAIFGKLVHEPSDERSIDERITEAAGEVGIPILFSQLIIILALIPIFTLQRVEGKLFRPLAFTISFAMCGALLCSLTLIPVLCSLVLRRTQERANPLMRIAQRIYAPVLRYSLLNRAATFAVIISAVLIGAIVFSQLGTDFLPKLDEGAIWVRATMPNSISLAAAAELTPKMRQILRSFPEVKTTVTQLGRPDDGTDPAGVNNAETFVDLRPKDEWRPGMTKEKLIAEMEAKLKTIPGVIYDFSQPITDNVDEAVSGVKGAPNSIKIFGDDLGELQRLANEIKAAIADVPGIAQLSADQLAGQAQLQIEIDRARAARYGLNVSDVQDVVETAIGGKVASQVVQGERRFDLVVRLIPEARIDVESIGSISVATPDGQQVPLRDIANLVVKQGYTYINREANQRRTVVRFDVRGRDLGSAIADAQRAVREKVRIPPGYRIIWSGQFENQQRAVARLKVILPVTVLMIFMVLYAAFNSVEDALIILLCVPFGAVGGVLALELTGQTLSVSAIIGFIALFGFSVLIGMLLVSAFNHKRRRAFNLREAVMAGARQQLRPVLMTASLAMLGLLPAAVSTEPGSEVQKPLAIVIIGGLCTATVLTLIAMPLIYELVKRPRRTQSR